MPDEEPETPPEWAVLKAYVNQIGSSEDAFIAVCWDEAKELVGNHIGGLALDEAGVAARSAALALVPSTVLTRCYLEAGSELYHRKSAPNGITQFATPDGNAGVRVARDPLVGVYPIAAPYMRAGFA
jgi:hypothetical protein